MRPGRAVMTAMRSDKAMASCRLCVTNTMVRSVRRRTPTSHSPMRSRVCSSSAPKGSSIRRMGVSSASARAMATRWRMPPESSRGYLASKPLRPIGSSSPSAISRRRAVSTPISSRPKPTLSSAVRHGKRPASWKTSATFFGFGPETVSPSIRMCPESGRTRPPIMPSTVDLPQPLGPRSETNSRGRTVRLTRSTAGTGPLGVS